MAEDRVEASDNSCVRKEERVEDCGKNIHGGFSWIGDESRCMRRKVTEVEDHNVEPGRWHDAKKAIAIMVGRIQTGGYLDRKDGRATANKCDGRDN